MNTLVYVADTTAQRREVEEIAREILVGLETARTPDDWEMILAGLEYAAPIARVLAGHGPSLERPLAEFASAA